MISANTAMRHTEEPRVTTHVRGPDTVFLGFEGLSILTPNGTVRDLEIERACLARQIERKTQMLEKLDRMIEVMKCGK